MKKVLIALVFLFFLSVSFLAGWISSYVYNYPRFTNPVINPQSITLDADKLWSLIQDWRIKNNFQSYIKDQRACDVAQKRVIQIQSDFSHSGFFEMFKNPTYSLAENLVMNKGNESDTLNAWLNSPDHLKDLKADYKYSCVVTENDYAVQIFANF